MLTRPSGAGLADHGCWAYRSAADRAAAATEWLAEGMRRGQRVLYVADEPPARLVADLGQLPGRAAALATGALIVRSVGEAYDLRNPIDARAQLRVYAAAVEQAMAAGFRGLRVAADITPLVANPVRRPAHLHWEQVADRYMTRRPLAPLCLYDQRVAGGIDAIVWSHPLCGPVERPFGLYATGPNRAALDGEVDVGSAAVFTEMLAGLPARDRVLDLSRLRFIDLGSSRILHRELARRRRAGQLLRLAATPPSVARLWDWCGLSPRPAP